MLLSQRVRNARAPSASSCRRRPFTSRVRVGTSPIMREQGNQRARRAQETPELDHRAIRRANQKLRARQTARPSRKLSRRRSPRASRRRATPSPRRRRRQALNPCAYSFQNLKAGPVRRQPQPSSARSALVTGTRLRGGRGAPSAATRARGFETLYRFAGVRSSDSRYSRNGSARSGLRSAKYTIAFKYPSLLPVSCRTPAISQVYIGRDCNSRLRALVS
jgi:hypothetical protein